MYVGQSANVRERFVKHKSEAKLMTDNMLIHEAMREFGFDNFYYEILEENVENPFQREKYWMRQLNTIAPNGYNVNADGVDYCTSVLTYDQLNSIVNDLIHTDITMDELAQKYQCSPMVISEINLGKTYFNNNLSYPLRNKFYSEELVKQIKYSLKYESDKSLNDIAREYNVDCSQVSKINQGQEQRYRYPNETYPLRNGKVKNVLDQKVIQNIIFDLIYNKELSNTDIARKYNVSQSQISSIIYGNSFRQDGLQYPLREINQAKYTKTIPLPIVRQIEEDLRNSTKSVRNIAKEYNTTTTQVQNINNGYIKKYRDPTKSYPLRDNRYYRYDFDIPSTNPVETIDA